MVRPLTALAALLGAQRCDAPRRGVDHGEIPATPNDDAIDSRRKRVRGQAERHLVG